MSNATNANIGTPVFVSTLNDGDRVRAKDGDIVVEGIVTGSEHNYRYIKGYGDRRLSMMADIRLLEQAKPVRPTVPGLYTDKDGDLVIVLSATKAVRLTNSQSTLRDIEFLTDDLGRYQEDAFLYLPFTLVAKF